MRVRSILFPAMSFSLFFLLASAVSASTPTPEEVTELKAFLTSGTIKQTHPEGKIRKKQFRPDGTLKNLGSGNIGKWYINEKGEMCQKWNKTKCRVMVREGNAYIGLKDGKKLWKMQIVDQ